MESYHPDHENPIVVSSGPVTSTLSSQGQVGARSFSSHDSDSAGQPHVVQANSRSTFGNAHGDRRAVKTELSVRRVLQIVFGRWLRIVIVAGCVLVCTAVAVLRLPPHYRSEAKLLVRLGRESVVIDPSARIGQSAVPMEGRDKEINSEIELLKSRKLVETVVSSLGVNRVLSLPPTPPATPGQLSKAIALVEDKLAIEAIPESNILSIQFESRDPEVARDLIAKLISAYLDERGQVYRERGDLKFFSDQLATARDEQAQIQKQIQEVRDSTGIADTAQQRQNLLTRSNRIQEEIDTDTASISAEEAAVDMMIARMGSATASQQRQEQLARGAMLKSTIHSLQIQKAATDQELALINAVEVKMQKLQQESTLTAARVTQYAEAYEQARIDREMGDQKLSNISIAEPPVLPLTPKAPSRSLLAVAGCFLAITLGLGSAFVAEAMDPTIRRAEDLQAFGLPAVSIPRVKRQLRRAIERNPGRRVDSEAIPALLNGFHEEGSHDAGSNGHSIERNVLSGAIHPAGYSATSSKVMKSVQGVIERLISSNEDGIAPRLIGVIAPRAGQGSSTIALHLAVSLAQRCQSSSHDSQNSGRVLLVDADVESCRASALAGVQIVRDDSDELRAVVSQASADANGRRWQKHLDVLTAALLEDKSLVGAQLPQMLRSFDERYRHIVIDLPAVADNESAARFAGLCNAVVLVCKGNELRVQTAGHAIQRLRDAHANVSVAVLNQRRYPVPEWIYRRS